MELYHIHIIGNHDRLYRENNEFVVSNNNFNNRIYDRIYKMNSTVDVNRYARIVNKLNYLCSLKGLNGFNRRINLGEIASLALNEIIYEDELIRILNDASEIILDEGINLREMAMEEYRRENCPNIPSRLHSLFACSLDGVEFWKNQLYDNTTHVFKIDVLDDPFVSNERLLPDESLDYGKKVEMSYKYFHPKNSDLDSHTNEYLVQGKVKILKRVM